MTLAISIRPMEGVKLHQAVMQWSGANYIATGDSNLEALNNLFSYVLGEKIYRSGERLVYVDNSSTKNGKSKL